MRRKQAVSVEPGASAEIKTRIPVWLYPSTLEVMDRAAETAGCKSRSEYLEKAALFYAGYVSGQEATAYLPPALASVLRGTVQDTENRICRLLFKLAVELDKEMFQLTAVSVTLNKFCSDEKIKVPEVPLRHQMRPASPEEAGFFYAQTPEKDEEMGAIGHLLSRNFL